MNLSVVKYAPLIQTEDRPTVHKHLDFLASVDYYFYCSVLYKHTFFIVPSCGFKLKFFPFKFKKVHLLTCSVLFFFFLQHPKTTCMHEMCFFNTAGCFTFEQQCSSEVQFNLNTTSFGNKVIIHERKKKGFKTQNYLFCQDMQVMPLHKHICPLHWRHNDKHFTASFTTL